MASNSPREFEFASETYRALRLSAWDQWTALQALKPTLADIEERSRSARGGRVSSADPAVAFTQALNTIPSEALASLFDLCLSGVERRDGGAWESVWDASAGVALFDDLGAGRVVLLTTRVLWDSLHGYFAYRPVIFDRTGDEPKYEPVQMPDGLSWFFSPVDRHLCLYESLFDGKLDLRDVARMNDLIAVSAENRARAQRAAEAEAARNRT